jgi:hypothetical protein
MTDNDQDFVVRSLESDALTPWYNQGAWDGRLDMCNVTHTNPVTGKPEAGPAAYLRFPHDWTSASGGPLHLPNGTNNRFYSRPGQMNNNAMAVLLPDNHSWVQMQPAYRCAPVLFQLNENTSKLSSRCP